MVTWADPILSYHVALADAQGHAEPGCEPWQAVGQHEVWVGRYPPSDATLCLEEWRPEGWAELPKAGPLMHRVPAGLPYRVRGLWGFWHIACGDMVWLQFPRADLTFYLLIAGGMTGLSGDHAVAWYCGQCRAELQRQDFPRLGSAARLLGDASASAVAAFNADPARRRCTACGWEHPPAYPFAPLGTPVPGNRW